MWVTFGELASCVAALTIAVIIKNVIMRERTRLLKTQLRSMFALCCWKHARAPNKCGASRFNLVSVYWWEETRLQMRCSPVKILRQLTSNWNQHQNIYLARRPRADFVSSQRRWALCLHFSNTNSDTVALGWIIECADACRWHFHWLTRSVCALVVDNWVLNVFKML